MTQGSPIIRVIARFAVPLSALVAIRIFFQGHDHPGGGFIAGVLLAAAGAMYLLAFGSREARRPWWRLSVLGLGIALLNGLVPLLRGQPFFDNTILHLAGLHLPTATFFDLGVLLVVVGTLMTIFVELGAERR